MTALSFGPEIPRATGLPARQGGILRGPSRWAENATKAQEILGQSAPERPPQKNKSSAVLWHLHQRRLQAGDAAVVLTASALPALPIRSRLACYLKLLAWSATATGSWRERRHATRGSGVDGAAIT